MDIMELLREFAKNPKNVRFADLCKALSTLGFVARKQKGSHITYTRKGVREIVTVQDDKGMAKPYQVRLFWI